MALGTDATVPLRRRAVAVLATAAGVVSLGYGELRDVKPGPNHRLPIALPIEP